MVRTRIVRPAVALAAAIVLVGGLVPYAAAQVAPGAAGTGAVPASGVGLNAAAVPGAVGPAPGTPAPAAPGAPAATAPGSATPGFVTQTTVTAIGPGAPATATVPGAAGVTTLRAGVLPGGVPATGVQVTLPAATNGLATVPGLTLTDRNTVRNGFTVPPSAPQSLVVGNDVTPGVPRIDQPAPLPVPAAPATPVTAFTVPVTGSSTTPVTGAGSVTVTTTTTFVTSNGVLIDTPASGLGSLATPSVLPSTP